MLALRCRPKSLGLSQGNNFYFFFISLRKRKFVFEILVEVDSDTVGATIPGRNAA